MSMCDAPDKCRGVAVLAEKESQLRSDVNDHETRIRAMERILYKLAAAAALGGSAGGIGASYLLKVFGG